MIITEVKEIDSGINYPSTKYFRENWKQYEEFLPSLGSVFSDKKVNLLVCGSSGLMFGSYIMMHLSNTNMIHFRKENESSHGCHVEYSSVNVSKSDINLIVDDFIVSGNDLTVI
jgi:hypothetical protein